VDSARHTTEQWRCEGYFGASVYVPTPAAANHLPAPTTPTSARRTRQPPGPPAAHRPDSALRTRQPPRLASRPQNFTPKAASSFPPPPCEPCSGLAKFPHPEHTPRNPPPKLPCKPAQSRQLLTQLPRLRSRVKQCVHRDSISAVISSTPRDDLSPTVEKFSEQCSEPLTTCNQPIIENLIQRGWAVRTVCTEYVHKFPPLFCDQTSRMTTERHEWQIEMESDGFLWLSFADPETVWLNFFYIHADRQGRGLGRTWFPRITNELFHAGARTLAGKPSPHSHYPCTLPLTLARLTAFYVREGGFRELGNGWIRRDRDADARGTLPCTPV